MVVGVNTQNEIVAVGETPKWLAALEVADDTFAGQDPTQFRIRVGDNWQEVTPKHAIRGL